MGILKVIGFWKNTIGQIWLLIKNSEKLLKNILKRYHQRNILIIEKRLFPYTLYPPLLPEHPATYNQYSKESERKTGGRPGIIDFRPNLASQFLYLDSGAGHDNVRRAKTRFSLVIVSVTFGLGNQQKPYDFKEFLMISGDFS